MIALPNFSAGGTMSAAQLNKVGQEVMRANLALGKGVRTGLEISPGMGLNVHVAAGEWSAQVSGQATADFDIPVAANSSGYLWIQSTDDPANPPDYLVQGTDADPGATYVCLGYYESGATAVTILPAPSLSPNAGRQSFGGALVSPQVASYVSSSMILSQSTGFVDVDVTTGDQTPLGGSAHLVLIFGTPGTARNVVLPTEKGLTWAVRNGSNAPVTIKTSGGAGVSVASGKTAFLACDGTNVFRLTADA